jgi:hypothetical protein
MKHDYIFKCSDCRKEFYFQIDQYIFKCDCGGELVQIGEAYDKEFLDKVEYEHQQDEEYEYRHRNERGR